MELQELLIDGRNKPDSAAKKVKEIEVMNIEPVMLLQATAKSSKSVKLPAK